MAKKKSGAVPSRKGKGKSQRATPTEAELESLIEAKARQFNSYPVDLTPEERFRLMRDDGVETTAWVTELPIKPLDKNCFKVLLCLNSRMGRLVQIVEIASLTDLDRGNVGKAIEKLEELRLACRPEGDRQGATLTAQGEGRAIHLLNATRKIDISST